MRIRATLLCGWCDREVEATAAELVEASGRVLVALAPGELRRSTTSAVCAHCGGPLLLEDWQAIPARLPIDPAELARKRAGRPRRPAA